MRPILSMAAAALVLALPARTEAASPITDAFVAGLHADGAFLRAAADLALQRSGGRGHRTEAKADLALDRTIARGLAAWRAEADREETASDDYPILGGANGLVGDAASLPITLGNRVTQAGTRAVDSVIAALPGRGDAGLAGVAPNPVPLGTPFLPVDREAYRHLLPAEGASFAALYRADRKIVYARLADRLADYIKNGDAESLRSLAVRLYPRINAVAGEPNRR